MAAQPNYLLEGFETERLLLRCFRPEDQQKWLEFFLDPSSTAYWEGIPADPEQACREQFERLFERYEKGLGGMNALIEKSSDQLAGMCGLLVQDIDGIQELEIGYSLLTPFRGKGYASEAARLCRDTAFENRWTPSLISIIHRDNTPSMRVAEGLGMKRDKQTVYKDNPVWIYRIHNDSDTS
ncbi:Protein N-acetyltransferase, RimJ/RimL family [Robiginitalea myxolifaciens]|uniref:Protein N-acetyltransferase, RimJ/RimL family n=1 Tax=Robiginitalea myxolifaciens TaxID=400055 RepID=A0A1I6HEU1_9FLAO|nr:GNAT family N-acetyltransferase [Robiginitalea myxolifaciens]SFR52860.1 Protein N-acetyltransferase, RimJ/RimL family [Robiginitalea myxolifaciens]